MELLLHYVSYLLNHLTTFLSSSTQVVHWSVELQTKVYNPRKKAVTNRLTKGVNSLSLIKLLFHILKNSHTKSN